MPDLGRYAAEVILAYAGTLAALGAVTALSVRRWRRLRRDVARADDGAPRG